MAIEVKELEDGPKVRDKDAIPVELSQHEFLLRTNSEYRDRVVVETVLKMAQLIDALAAKNGLSFENGKIVGLSNKEEEKILLKSLTAESHTVREWSPEHEVIEASAEDNFDGFALSPDPDHEPTSETPEETLADAEPDAGDEDEEVDAPKRRRRSKSTETPVEETAEA